MSEYAKVKEFVWRNAHVTRVVCQPPWSMVAIAMGPGGEEYFGFARCCPRDTYDEDLGLTIARGRAEAAMARSIMAEEAEAEHAAASMPEDVRILA